MYSDCLSAALFYRKEGFSVIPLNPNSMKGSEKDGKRPYYGFKWEKYQTEKASEEEIKGWWKTWPEAIVGIVTGKISGITVVDAEKEADLSILGLADCLTACTSSGGGGMHYYFSYTPSVANCSKFVPFHDIRNDGGYIVAPPSRHKSGNIYSWNIPIGLAPLLPFPDNIVNAYARRHGIKNDRKDWDAVLKSKLPEGSRNETLTSITGKLLVKMDERDWESVAWNLLKSWNFENAKPPVSERELRVIFDSISRSERSRRLSGDKIGEPVITRENGLFVVRTPIDGGSAVFSFEEPIYSRGDLEAIVKCHVEIPDRPIRTFETRLNVLSGSSCESYARQLTASYGKEIKWNLLLSEAISKFREAYKDTATEDIRSSAEIFPETPCFLLGPFIEENSANMLFAKGGVGKTYLALRWALSLATGEDFLGSVPSKRVKTLFLDYENSPGTFKHRILMLGGGLGKYDTETEKFLYYKDTKGVPIYDMKDNLRKFVVEKGIGLVIVDSAAPACGGPPEDAAVATKYFSALRHIGITSLTIGHEAKADNGNWTFGSVFFTNLSRNIWNLKSDSEEGDLDKKLSLSHKKFNNGPLSPPMAIKMVEGLGFLKYENDGSSSVLSRNEKNILDCLRKDEDTTIRQIYDSQLGLSEGAVRAQLDRLKKKGRIMNGIKRGSWRISA